jgi:DNA-directed RNA polymerase delta subunit
MKNLILEKTEFFFNQLNEKQKIILMRRFGIGVPEKETLESIGKDLGVTRERVRQIEKKALESIKKDINQSGLKKVYQKIKNFLGLGGGIKKEEKISEDLGLREVHNELLFLLHIHDDFYRFRENDIFYTFWAIDPSKAKEIERILEITIRELEKINQPLTQREFFNDFRKRIKIITGKNLSLKVFYNYFEIFKPIKVGLDGKIGLIHWPEIRPRGVRDRAYIVLKNQGKPLHFREIAQLIDQLDSSKRTHVQTLHNELIKDERFILVGRGYYALKEWGYQPGLLKDVIVSILENSQKPLTREEIIEEVQKQRIVKPSTIVSALYDKSFFQKTADGRYFLKIS